MKFVSLSLDYTRVYPALLLFLSVVSWVTSAGGLFSWFSNSVNHAIALTMAFGLSAFIQAAIAGMWFGVSSRLIPIYIKPFCLALALSLSVVSGGLASGSWMLLTAGGALQSLSDTKAFGSLASPLTAFRDQFDAVQDMMRSLSVLSAAKEAEEARAGSSCDGPPVGIGHGPRARLRALLAKEARENAEIAAQLSEEGFTIATLSPDAVDADFVAAYKAARALSRDERLLGLRAWIEKTRRGFREGFRDTTDEAKQFVCNDRETTKKLLEAQTALAALPDLPDVPPRKRAFTFADSVRNSYGQIFMALGFSEGSGDPDWDAGVRDVSAIAFAFAGAIEVVIVLLVLLSAMISNAGMVNGAPIGLALHTSRYDDCRQQIELLNKLVIEEGSCFYFCLPEDGSETLRNHGRNFVRRWRLQVADGATAIVLNEIAPVAAELLAVRGVDAQLYTVYALPRRLINWWTRAVRDLAVSRSYEEQPQASACANNKVTSLERA